MAIPALQGLEPRTIPAVSNTIHIGDKYVRPGERWPTYRVVRMVEFDRHPPHVLLVSETSAHRSITIGAEVLTDWRQWVRAE